MHIYKYTCLNCGAEPGLCAVLLPAGTRLRAGCRGTEPSPARPALPAPGRSSVPRGRPGCALKVFNCVRLGVYKQKRLSLCFQDCKRIAPLRLEMLR